MFPLILIISACDVLIPQESEKAQISCFGVVDNWVKENPSLNLELELQKWCGSEILNNTVILADDFGYKMELILNYNGINLAMPYYPNLKDSIEWLKKNTNNNARILAWWDYGAMIKLIGEREPIAMFPSKEANKYVGTYLSKKESTYAIHNIFSDDKTIKKIATVLTTDNPSEAVRIMKELNAKYLFIPREMKGKFGIAYKLLYDKFKSIKDEDSAGLKESELDSKSITYKALNNQTIPSFKQVYSDESAIIYEVSAT